MGYEKVAPGGARVAIWVAAAVAAAAVLAGLLAAPAPAGKKVRGIKPVSRSDKGATKLVRSIFEGENKNLVRAKFVAIPPGHDPAAISTRKLAGFPGRGGEFAILSTGCAHFAPWRDFAPDSGCLNGGVKTRGARDVTILRIRLKVPKGNNCLSFRFKFLSEEYPEFAGSEFNDAFIAELSHSPRWKASDNQSPSISAPGDFATTRNGQDIISVNGTGVAKVSRGAAKGTTYDAATGKLRASTRVKPGVRLLYLSIFDQGDRQWDSAVFVDRLTIDHKKKCRSGLAKTK